MVYWMVSSGASCYPRAWFSLSKASAGFLTVPAAPGAKTGARPVFSAGDTPPLSPEGPPDPPRDAVTGPGALPDRAGTPDSLSGPKPAVPGVSLTVTMSNGSLFAGELIGWGRFVPVKLKDNSGVYATGQVVRLNAGHVVVIA